jgi:hypothetical protein
MRIVYLSSCISLLVAAAAVADVPVDRNQPKAAPSLRELAVQATAEDGEAARREAIAELRAAGPSGLAALLDANSDAIARHRRGEAAESSPQEQQRWGRACAALDAVAAQKDAWASGLYWHTDLEAAKAAARASGKPILSLRLLGRLDQEYSCANSRFFRTVLYANAEVSKVLSERFVLHWKSVRPVPKVTIDFGDGRVVERTITGNSIHYVLDAEGRVIDGIPGLYGPKAFLREIERAANALDVYQRKPEAAAALRRWHAGMEKWILNAWQNDLRQVGAVPTDAPKAAPAVAAPPKNPPAAAVAPLAVGKALVESRLVVAIAPDPKALEAASTDGTWAKLAALHAEDARLDASSRALMASKNPDALTAGRLTAAKRVVESPLLRMTANFERSIAEDTVRNQYTFHRQIHAWLASGTLPDGKSATADVDALNERVYAELFLTPSSDPWLGLLPGGTYSALPNDGVCPAK